MNSNNNYTIKASDRLSKEEVKKILKNSSGLILKETDGKLTLGYVDFYVPEFGGRDYECFYRLDLQNSNLLKETLKSRDKGDLFEQCVEAFTIKFSNDKFETFCDENSIEYKKTTW